MSPRRLRAVWLGQRPYGPVLELQRQLFEARRAGQVGDTLLLLEHAPVITRGRGARSAHILAAPEQLAAAGIELFESERGGDVTLHAPGQLVVYPIFDLHPDWQDVRRYVRALTSIMGDIVREAGISAGTIDEYIGLWADERHIEQWPGQDSVELPVKLGAVGVRISRWVTMHGFALNLNPDLELFRWIVPCGISQYGVSSVARLTGKAPTTFAAGRTALDAFIERFGALPTELEDLSREDFSRITIRLLSSEGQTVSPSCPPIQHAHLPSGPLESSQTQNN